MTVALWKESYRCTAVSCAAVSGIIVNIIVRCMELDMYNNLRILLIFDGS